MYKIFFLLLITGYAYVTHALTEAEAKIEFTRYAMKCLKEVPVEVTELMNLQKYITPTKPEVKCLLACTYKLEGSMKPDGLFDIEHLYNVAERMKNGDEKRLENGKKVADTCIKVNEETVSDGEKGCERAALMFKCNVENAPKYGFKLV